MQFVVAGDASGSKSIGKICGSCPEGYATTGVTTALEICKDSDPFFVSVYL